MTKPNFEWDEFKNILNKEKHNFHLKMLNMLLQIRKELLLKTLNIVHMKRDFTVLER